MLKPKVLTPQQANFVINYIKTGGNAYQAAIKAGYAEDFANTKTKVLMNLPHVKQEISKAYKRVDNIFTDKLGITMTYKAKALKRMIDNIMRDDDRDHYKDAIKAIDQLNKMQGDYAPERRLNLTVDATREKLEEVRKQYEEY